MIDLTNSDLELLLLPLMTIMLLIGQAIQHLVGWIEPHRRRSAMVAAQVAPTADWT